MAEVVESSHDFICVGHKVDMTPGGPFSQVYVAYTRNSLAPLASTDQSYLRASPSFTMRSTFSGYTDAKVTPSTVP